MSFNSGQEKTPVKSEVFTKLADIDDKLDRLSILLSPISVDNGLCETPKTPEATTELLQRLNKIQTNIERILTNIVL